MGDIIRTLEIYDLRSSKRGLTVSTRPAALVQAVVDAGASLTVVPRRVARQVRSVVQPIGRVNLEGRLYPVRLMMVRLVGPNWAPKLVSVVVSDELAARTATEGVSAVLGHEYTQKDHVGIFFSSSPAATSGACGDGFRSRLGRPG
jgi:hypothetical protein